MKETQAVIEQVKPGGIGDELGLEKGDRLVSVNGQEPRDFIDYLYLCAEEDLALVVEKADGEIWECDIEKEVDEDLGIGFTQDTFDGMKNCANKCVFCFVDQMPPDLRDSLYVKDDDYRLSFLHGNFVTLTNVADSDLDRMVRMRISPLYISVHTTHPDLRKKMLGNKNAGRIMKQLTTLARAGIELHTQIVLCPGLNDGSELDRTLRDLVSLYPAVKSVAVVPVGLTRFREHLPALRSVLPEEAGQIVRSVQLCQEDCLQKYGLPVVYLADEVYVAAGHPVPPATMYGDFPQLENGVGLVRVLYDSLDAFKSKRPKALPAKKKVVLVTGLSGAEVLKPAAAWLAQVKNLEVTVLPVSNSFFGERVTVAGLLTGRDVLSALQTVTSSDLVLLPSVMCRRDEPVFLDGLTPAGLEQKLGIPVRVVDLDQGAQGLIEAIVG